MTLPDGNLHPPPVHPRLQGVEIYDPTGTAVDNPTTVLAAILATLRQLELAVIELRAIRIGTELRLNDATDSDYDLLDMALAEFED